MKRIIGLLIVITLLFTIIIVDGCGKSSHEEAAIVGTIGFKNGSKVLSRAWPMYEYGATIIKEEDTEVWFCGRGGEHIGDTIFYSINNSTPIPVFSPTGSNTFDRNGVCDPYVIRWEGNDYLYYSGLNMNDVTQGIAITEIGLAISPAKQNRFTRYNNGNPIVVPYTYNTVHTYGAGQPSVNYVNGQFYMIYHDSTRPEGDSGFYVISSDSPYFTNPSEPKYLKMDRPVFKARHPKKYMGIGVSPAMVYSPKYQSFIVILCNRTKGVTLNIYNTSFQKTDTFEVFGMDWREGYGIASNSVGQLDDDFMEVIYPTGKEGDFFDMDLMTASWKLVGK